MKKVLAIVVALVIVVTFVNHFIEIRSQIVSDMVENGEIQDSADTSQKNEEDGSATAADPLTEVVGAEGDDQGEQQAGETAEAKKHRYQVVQADVTWEEAVAKAKEAGGYLAVITSQEEFDEVAALAEQSDLLYLWLGAEADNKGNFSWKNGEPFTYTNWYPGEPSRKDADGTPETCLCMWKVNGQWSWNDQRNDLIAGYSLATGKVGYVIEYEEN